MHRKALIPDRSINGFLIFCLIILLACYFYSICTSPFTIFHWDPLNGFLALKNFEGGGPFNYIHSVLATDVSKTKVEWLSWWSPGQYMIPYFFQTIGHLSFINSVKATVIFSILVFVPGVIVLFSYFNFSLRVSLLCVLIFLVQRMIFLNTWGYDGGDILFICFLPWYLRGFLYLYDSGNFLFQFLSIFLLTLFAVFIKLTFIVVAISLLLFLLLNSFINRNDVKTNIMSVFSVKNVSAGLGIILALGVVYVIFLSKGINPNQLNGIHFHGKDSLELLFMPISIFSFTGLTTFLLAKSLAAAVFIYILLLLAVFVVCRMVMDFKNDRLKIADTFLRHCIFYLPVLFIQLCPCIGWRPAPADDFLSLSPGDHTIFADPESEPYIFFIDSRHLRGHGILGIFGPQIQAPDDFSSGGWHPGF